jgi:Flp pilus assembly protein TadG
VRVRKCFQARHAGLRRGSSALELAIVLPVLVTIILGAVDFGRFAYNFIALSNAVRAGASWAMMNPPSSMASPPSAWQTSVQTAVSNEMSLQAGFDSGSLTVATVTPAQDSDSNWQFTVSATHPFQTMINWSFGWMGTSLAVPNSTTLSQSVTMRFIRP